MTRPALALGLVVVSIAAMVLIGSLVTVAVFELERWIRSRRRGGDVDLTGVKPS